MTLLILSIAIIALITNRNNLIQDLKIQSRILGESLSASIAFNDAQSAQHLLEALRWSPYIQKVVVLNREGQTFSSYPLQVK